MCTASLDLVSSTPILAPNGANNIFPPSPNTSSTPHQLQQQQQQQSSLLLLSEHAHVLLKKAWNIFEYSISFDVDTDKENNHVDNLLLERHLDQLLMCAIYAACKISQLSCKFQDIMKHYRAAVAARSHSSHLVYRSVLMPDASRADLISFYNHVFLTKLKPYLVQMSQSSGVEVLFFVFLV